MGAAEDDEIYVNWVKQYVLTDTSVLLRSVMLISLPGTTRMVMVLSPPMRSASTSKIESCSFTLCKKSYDTLFWNYHSHFWYEGVIGRQKSNLDV